MKRADLERFQKRFELFYDRLEDDLEWYEQSFWSVQPKASGVYVIYLHTESHRVRVIYVGHGNVRQRIKSHQKSESGVMSAVPRVQDRYKLCVAWAIVKVRKDRKGIERYLAEELFPEAGELWHNDNPIKVNPPQFRLHW